MKQIIWIPLALVVLIAGCKKNQPATLVVLTTASATNITSTSAQVGGTISSNGGSAITKSGICWALHSGPTISDSVTTSGAVTGSFTGTLNNLLAYTTYYVRAYAINGQGTSYGDEISFVTASGLPTITTTAVSNNQGLSAVSGWALVNFGGSEITAIGLCWSTSPHPTPTGMKTLDNPTANSYADTISNLTLTTYYVRAYATNSAGTAYGNEISFAVSSTNTITDIDGNAYPTVVIGTQTWMGSNLKTTHYQNGDPITNGSAANYSWNFTTGAFTYPHDDSTNNATYGKYYNVVAVNDARGACPTGWHVPTDGDWETLEFYEGMAASDTGSLNFRGTIGAKLLVGGSSGLNLQTATYFFYNGGYQSGAYGLFWTSTNFQSGSGNSTLGNWFRAFNLSGTGPIYRNYGGSYAMSVRCVKN